MLNPLTAFRYMISRLTEAEEVVNLADLFFSVCLF